MAPFTYEYPRPGVTVDAILLAMRERSLSVLLIRRRDPPFAESWALPGGFVDPDEDLSVAARRELQEETGVRIRSLVQIGAYGAPGRDPRGHTVGVAFLALVSRSPRAVAADDAIEVGWHPLTRPPPLAFDHSEMLRDTRKYLRRNLERDALAFSLLPRRFSLDELRAVHEAVYQRPVDAAAFARRATRLQWLERDPDDARARFRFARARWRAQAIDRPS